MSPSAPRGGKRQPGGPKSGKRQSGGPKAGRPKSAKPGSDRAGGAKGRAQAAKATSRGSGGSAAKPARGAKKAKPRSAAAEKAIESRRVKHAAASARKADRPGGRAGDRRGGSGRERPPAQRSGPKGLGGEQIEGRQAVREALLAGRRRVREVLVATEQDDTEALQDLVDLALDLGVTVNEVTRSRLLSMARTEAPQGVLAKADPLPEVELDELVIGSAATPPFLLAVDGVTDPGNLGALLRSAECAGVTGVVLPRHRAVHVTPTVTKAAAGAVEYLPIALAGGLPAAIGRLRSLGVWVVGLDMAGDDSLFTLPAAITTEPVCLVLGAEGRGLSRLVRQRCDTVASIPLGGRLASLNVAAAGALACFEITRHRLG